MTVAVRAMATLLFAAAVSAPVQCGSKARPEHRFEEEPAEALYKLADRFSAKGDRAARIETLRFLVERYPTSRFAEAAKIDLADLDAGAAPLTTSAPPRLAPLTTSAPPRLAPPTTSAPPGLAPNR